MGTAATRQNMTTILKLEGRLDLAASANVKVRVKELLDNGTLLIHLSLHNVDFINTAGLGALVSMLKEVRLQKGRLTLSNLSEFVREMFDLTQLSQIFEIYPSEEEALASYAIGRVE